MLLSSLKPEFLPTLFNRGICVGDHAIFGNLKIICFITRRTVTKHSGSDIFVELFAAKWMLHICHRAFHNKCSAASTTYLWIWSSTWGWSGRYQIWGFPGCPLLYSNPCSYFFHQRSQRQPRCDSHERKCVVTSKMWSQQDKDCCCLSNMSSLLSWLSVLSAVP